MSAEVRPEEPLTPEPGPIRGKKFTTTTLMVGLIILVAGAAAIALGKVANTALSLRRTEKVRADLYAWKAQLAKDNPSIVFAVVVEGSTVDLLGTSLHHNGKYTTPTGRPVLIDLEYLDRPFDPSGRLVLTAEGRWITWPIEDIERGRKVDLKAEFPEAFR